MTLSYELADPGPRARNIRSQVDLVNHMLGLDGARSAGSPKKTAARRK
jgi:hypothetical protein